MRVDKFAVHEHVTATEAVEVGKYRTIKDMFLAYDIYTESLKDSETGSPEYDFRRALANIWNAGRIQGIREERIKRKSVTA